MVQLYPQLVVQRTCLKGMCYVIFKISTKIDKLAHLEKQNFMLCLLSIFLVVAAQ